MSFTNERARVLTALGWEVQCARCDEFWPEDPEFYFMKNGKAHSWCKACYRDNEKVVAKVERWKARQRKNPLVLPERLDFASLAAVFQPAAATSNHATQGPT